MTAGDNHAQSPHTDGSNSRAVDVVRFVLEHHENAPAHVDVAKVHPRHQPAPQQAGAPECLNTGGPRRADSDMLRSALSNFSSGQ